MADLGYAPEVLALWTEKDEAACKEWCDGKIKEFEAGGKIKEKYATIEELQVSVLRRHARLHPFGTVPDHGIPCKQPTALRYLRGVAMVERGWQKWMDETNYGKGGTKDKTLKIRGNPKECSAIVPLGHVLRASGRRQTQRPMLHSQTELVGRRRWSLAPRRHCPCASPVARPE